MDDEELAQLLADPALWSEPDPGLEDRVVAAVTAAAVTQTATQTATETATRTVTPSVTEGRPPGDLDAARHRRARRVVYSVLGVAASVLLAVSLTVFLVNRDTSEQYAATLVGTDLAPGVTGEVTLTKTQSGWRIHLHATGLPRRADGSYYEAWLKSTTGVLVPIGTFNQGDDVTLWAGVPPSSHPLLTVTRQLANGNPASSGQVVLTGMTHRTR